MRNQNIASLVWANDMPYSCAQRLESMRYGDPSVDNFVSSFPSRDTEGLIQQLT